MKTTNSRGVHSRYVHIKDPSTEKKAPFAVGPTKTKLSSKTKESEKKTKKVSSLLDIKKTPTERIVL